jgi:alkylated DNA repair dioxygenase AlkB
VYGSAPNRPHPGLHAGAGLTWPAVLAKIEHMFVATEHSDLPTTFQASLFAGGAPAADARFRTSTRAWLDDESWIDVVPGWLAGADSLFDHLAACLPWKQRTVPMYDRIVDEPRLVHWWSDSLPPAERQAAVNVPILHEMRLLVSVRYGHVFDSFGCNFYRSGRDSVAWHSDRTGSVTEATIAVLSLGGTRPFHVRPKGGGRSVTFLPASGDLIVLGGRTNDVWEHAIPKVHRADPRISIAFRHGSERRAIVT